MSDLVRRWTRRLPAVVTGVPFLVTAGILVALFVTYVLAGFFLVPRLITSYWPRFVAEKLHRRAEVGEVRFNPLLFKLEIKGLRLSEADGRPLLSWDRLFVDFEPTGVFRRAWTFAEIQLDAPRLDVILLKNGRLNLLELLDALPKSEAPRKPSPPPRLLLQHAVVRGGFLTFTDETTPTPQTAAIEPFDIELHNITTVPERRGPYAIAATLKGGGVVGWDGDVSLVPLGSTGRLGLKGFPLATAWRFAQDRATLAEPSGRLDAEVRYRLAYQDGAMAFTVEDVGVTVDGLALAQRGERTPMLTLEKIRVARASANLVSREVTIPEILVSRGRLGATLARDGTLNWQTLWVPPPAAPPPPVPPTPPTPSPPSAARPAPAAAATARAAPPWRVGIEKVRVEDVALAIVDQSRAAPVGIDVAGLTLDLSARLESGAAGLVGEATGIELKLGRISAHAAGAPVILLDGAAVDGGHVDLAARRLTVARVAVTGGSTTIERAADGSLPIVAAMASATQAPRARAGPAAAAPASAVKPWSVAVEEFSFGGHRLSLTDRSVNPAVALQIEDARTTARGVRTDGDKPFVFETSFRVAQGGRFTASGRLTPDGRTAEAKLSLVKLALRPVQPYLARTAGFELRSGEASTSGTVTYRRRGTERAAITFTGSADVDGLLLVEPQGGERVLSWKSLHAGPIRLGLAPDRLGIDEVRFTELDGKLTIYKDKSTSLARVLRRPGAPPAAAAAPPATAAVTAPPTPAAATGSAPPPAPAAPAEAAFPVVIDRVRLDQASADFADLSLALPFSTRIHSLNGVIVGLGSAATSRATVKLDGRVDEFGLVKVDGTIAPFNPKEFTDLRVTFRNVPLGPLTPYSTTFVGRRIAGGTLNLDLEYKLDHSELVGENRVVLTRLQLGERVESPGAMSLPLDLAIALLSDSEGRIDMAMPVRGNVDHPQFAYGELVWQALTTVIKNIAAAPFRALGRLFGGSGERLEAVVFDAGSDTVPPPEREKLRKVAEVLGKRPRLTLTVHGGYEAKADGDALRSLRVRRDLAERLEAKLNPGEDPGPVAFDSVKTQRALEAMYTGRGRSMDEFVTEYEKAGKKAERANPVLALVGRGAGDRDFYTALFRRLVETTPLPDTELTALGRRRGEAIVRLVRAEAGEAAGRVMVGDAEAAERGERNTVPARLELGAT